DLPSVDALGAHLGAESDLPRPLVIAVARDAIEQARTAMLAGEPAEPALAAATRLRALADARPREVINATGVLLHTNLGRAPLPEPARSVTAPGGYTNVEFDLDGGRRGRRGRYVRALAAALVGAPAALVVNNNAGALLLALAAVAGRSGRVAVSRGELIEIGGSFRLPELMTASGARLVEVGTTNRTRLDDYERMIGHVEAVLKVHPSNYRVEGFTEEVGFEALADLTKAAGTPFIADIGSGLLDTGTPWLPGGPPTWLSGEPGAVQTLSQGADVVLFSGDKLLGGPQAGIAAGSESVIARMGAHPLARALRVPGATLESLGEVLEMYATGRGREIPFWEMASIPETDLENRSRALLARSGASGTIVDGESLPGAGSVPGMAIPSRVIRLGGPSEATWQALLHHDPPIVASRRDGAVHLDLRTVDPRHDPLIATALASLEV
ncbi:MAG: L-seryl-tRNA(Sec) selenium transferase, partial [Actinomycetota bacterium]|nr:L-seryl-tRNA(Sec) selenium transferase [Actinomycetota bacterium]